MSVNSAVFNVTAPVDDRLHGRCGLLSRVAPVRGRSTPSRRRPDGVTPGSGARRIVLGRRRIRRV